MDQVSEIRAAGVLIVRAGVPTELCKTALTLHSDRRPLGHAPQESVITCQAPSRI